MEKVILAMSGGVDSSVSAFLLKQQGYEVIGATFCWNKNSSICVKDSNKVCEKLGIEHIIFEYKNEFQTEIVDKFNKYIKNGLIPNPCVWCNQIIKFGKMFEICKQQGAKFSTGHYVKLKDNRIYRAKDLLKDQSYFLCNIKREILGDLIFPLGDYLKSEIFRIAEKNNLLELENYKESQGVCFFKDQTYTEYFKNLNIEEKKGDIIHIETKKKLGEHNGLLKYAIGQRKGFGVSYSEPLYVIEKDFSNNILYVGEKGKLYTNEINIKDLIFLVEEFENKNTFECKVCLRDKSELIDAEIIKQDNNKAKVVLKKQVYKVSKGQWCVFYIDNMLIGGGEII